MNRSHFSRAAAKWALACARWTGRKLHLARPISGRRVSEARSACSCLPRRRSSCSGGQSSSSSTTMRIVPCSGRSIRAHWDSRAAGRGARSGRVSCTICSRASFGLARRSGRGTCCSRSSGTGFSKRPTSTCRTTRYAWSPAQSAVCSASSPRRPNESSGNAGWPCCGILRRGTRRPERRGTRACWQWKRLPRGSKTSRSLLPTLTTNSKAVRRTRSGG
jgi:hypothetical protein